MKKSVCVAALCKEISAFQRGVFCNMRTKELKEFIFVRSSFLHLCIFLYENVMTIRFLI